MTAALELIGVLGYIAMGCYIAWRVCDSMAMSSVRDDRFDYGVAVVISLIAGAVWPVVIMIHGLGWLAMRLLP